VHFGLGSAQKVDYVEIRWPSGLVERFANPALDKILTLREGSGAKVDPSPKKPLNTSRLETSKPAGTQHIEQAH
jgi:hypothetical protein